VPYYCYIMKKTLLSDKKNVHFVGIGGIGMSALAQVLLEMDYEVSGSDIETSGITKRLVESGGRIYEGHSASNLPKDADLLVYSSSISKENPELVEAKRRGIKIVHRSDVLGGLFNGKLGIAITGTHGKTTTTSLISVMLKSSGLDPTIIVGGEVASLNGNARLGKGTHVVAEADESDSSFLRLKPFYAVVTNVEMEHIDHFHTLMLVKKAYGAFIGNIKKRGVLFYNYDDQNLQSVIHSCRGGLNLPYSSRKIKFRSFGFSDKADIYPSNIKMDGFRTSFDCIRRGKPLGRINLRIPGRHNIMNAMAAVSVGLELGINFKKIAGSLAKFEGTKRRFQLRADSGGVMLIDDYAHHPTEIRAVLDASRGLKRKRTIVIFQPHRYTRTKFLADEFGRCFGGADKLILTDIYAASEEPIKGVSIDMIRDRVIANGIDDVVVLKKEMIAGHVIDQKRPGDMIIVMGAGDIKKVADELCEKLKETSAELKKIVKGEVKTEEPLDSHTSLKIGGKASLWFEPSGLEDLKKALAFAAKKNLPTFVIGNGSNILAKDEGFKGMLIRLAARDFKTLEIHGTFMRVGAGFSLPKLVMTCCDKGLAGLESLVGIPGTVGGAIYMNAGGWTNPIFRNIGEAVQSLKVISPRGKVRTLKKADLKFGYRHSNLRSYIIVEALLRLKDGDRSALMSSCSKFLKMKREKQVLDIPSAGCVFKNPPGSQFTCGQMIDTLGLKGKRIGDAEISAKHANFILNRGGATSKDMLALIELVKDKVKESYDIDLELEVKIP